MADLPHLRIPEAPNVPVAPNPAMPSPALQARRNIPVAPAMAQQTVARNPVSAPTPASVQPAPEMTMTPTAYAIGNYQETGDFGSAFAQGWVNAGAAREAMAKEEAAQAQAQAEKLRVEQEAKASRKAAADLIRQQYPQMEMIARGVEIGAWDSEAGLQRASEMASEAQNDAQTAALRQQQAEYLRNAGRADLADMLLNGLLSTEDVAKSIMPGGGDMSAKEEQIARLMSTGLSRDQAIGIADGRMRLDTNPVTGERVIVDLGVGTSSPVAQPNYDETPAPGEQGSASDPGGLKLWDMVDDATGVASSVGVVSSNTLGQLPGALGDAFTDEAAVRAEREFELFKRDLIRSLSLNPRFPVAEQQRIEGLMERGAFVDSGTLRISLETMDREMARIERELSASVQDPGTPLKQRAADQQTLRAIRAARQRMGVPQDAGDSQGAADTGSGVESMTDEELLELLGQ